MRRDIKIRKKNRIRNEVLNKKILTIIFVLSVLLAFIFLYFFFIIRWKFINDNFENDFTRLSSENLNESFSLDKISVITSATANSDVKNLSYWSLDISLFSDIGIYLNNHQNYNIEKIYIDEIEFSSNNLGTPMLYRKEFKDIGTPSFLEENILKNGDILDLKDDFPNSVFIGFYNKNIKCDYIFSGNNKKLDINGTILKKANILKSSINSNISFNLHIITDTKEHFVCNINLNIPLEDDKGNDLYDTGYIIKTFDNLDNYKFLKTN